MGNTHSRRRQWPFQFQATLDLQQYRDSTGIMVVFVVFYSTCPMLCHDPLTKSNLTVFGLTISEGILAAALYTISPQARCFFRRSIQAATNTSGCFSDRKAIRAPAWARSFVWLTDSDALCHSWTMSLCRANRPGSGRLTRIAPR